MVKPWPTNNSLLTSNSQSSCSTEFSQSTYYSTGQSDSELNTLIESEITETIPCEYGANNPKLTTVEEENDSLNEKLDICAEETEKNITQICSSKQNISSPESELVKIQKEFEESRNEVISLQNQIKVFETKMKCMLPVTRKKICQTNSERNDTKPFDYISDQSDCEMICENLENIVEPLKNQHSRKCCKRITEIITSQYEEERTKMFEMQNDMIDDLEKLILALEHDKKELIKKIDMISNENNIIITEKNDLLRINSENTLKIELMDQKLSTKEKTDVSLTNGARIHNKFRSTESMNMCKKMIHEKEQELEKKLSDEKKTFDNKVDHMKKDMAIEIDMLESMKDEETEELVTKFHHLESEFTSHLSEMKEFYESLLNEEKTQFARTMISKVYDYENKLSEKCDEIVGLEIDINRLQDDVNDKLIVIEELEARLEDSSHDLYDSSSVNNNNLERMDSYKNCLIQDFSNNNNTVQANDKTDLCVACIDRKSTNPEYQIQNMRNEHSHISTYDDLNERLESMLPDCDIGSNVTSRRRTPMMTDTTIVQDQLSVQPSMRLNLSSNIIECNPMKQICYSSNSSNQTNSKEFEPNSNFKESIQSPTKTFLPYFGTSQSSIESQPKSRNKHAFSRRSEANLIALSPTDERNIGRKTPIASILRPSSANFDGILSSNNSYPTSPVDKILCRQISKDLISTEVAVETSRSSPTKLFHSSIETSQFPTNLTRSTAAVDDITNQHSTMSLYTLSPKVPPEFVLSTTTAEENLLRRMVTTNNTDVPNAVLNLNEKCHSLSDQLQILETEEEPQTKICSVHENLNLENSANLPQWHPSFPYEGAYESTKNTVQNI